VHTERFAVRVHARANDRSPVPVDLVLVRDKETLGVVLPLTARQWFQQRDQLLRDHPGSLHAEHWEFVPGQARRFDRLPMGRSGVALIIFADYLTPGPHRARVGHLQRFTLVLGERDFQVVPDEN